MKKIEGLTVEKNLKEENIGLADIKKMGYEAGEEAFEKIKGKFNNKPDHKAYKEGFFQGYIDNLGDAVEKNLKEENIGLADIKKMGYEAGGEAFEKIKGKFNNKPDHKAYKEGFFQGYIDNLGDAREDYYNKVSEGNYFGKEKAEKAIKKTISSASESLKEISKQAAELVDGYELSDLESNLEQIYRDMEQEAEPEGGPIA